MKAPASQAGFGMAELLITAGLTSVVATSVAAMMVDQIRWQAKFDLKRQAVDQMDLARVYYERHGNMDGRQSPQGCTLTYLEGNTAEGWEKYRSECVRGQFSGRIDGYVTKRLEPPAPAQEQV